MSSNNFDNGAPGAGDEFAPAYEDDYRDEYASDPDSEQQHNNKNGVNWPTVAAAAGVAVLVAALITTIGVVGAIRGGDSGKDATIAMYEQMLASQKANGTNGAAGSANRGPTNRGSADRAQRDRKSSSDRASHQGRSNSAASGANPASGNAQQVQPVEPVAPVDDSGIEQPASDDGGYYDQELAPNWGPSNVDAHLHRMMDQSTPDQEIADGLEAGNAGVPVIRSVQARFNAFRLVYSWELDYDSVFIEGDTLYADLILALSGYGSKNLDLMFYDIDAMWKLSNESLCKLAQQARTDCPV